MPIIRIPKAATHEMGGNRFTSVATPSNGSSETSVWYVEIPPANVPAPHSLTREEVFVVLAGSASVRIGGESADVASGNAFVVPVGSTFELTNSGSNPLRLLCCMPVGGQAQLADGTMITPPWSQ